MKIKKILITVLLWSSSIAIASAQSPTSIAPTLSTRSTLVLVPALVRDKTGNLIFTLTADDFVLTDDGLPQKLTLEPNTGAEPLALVVLVEFAAASQSSRWHPDPHDQRPDRFRPVPTMVDALTGNVPRRIAVVAFDSKPSLLQNFTSDIGTVADALHDLSTTDTGDHGAAILDSLGFSLDLLRKQPSEYRRAILLLSETNDRGSHIKLEEAVRNITDANTVIYSLAFSTGKAEASRYGYKELPTKIVEPTDSDWLVKRKQAKWMIGFENANPGPPHGCMGKDDPNQDATRNKSSQAYDCLTQLLPPLALAKMAAIAATDGLKRNIPETVAHLTGGEYFKLTDPKNLERDLATISNHIPNRYVLSFQPQSPHPGLHALTLQLKDYPTLHLTARNTYWADTDSLTH